MSLLIANARVVTGAGSPPLASADVQIEGTRIAKIGRGLWCPQDTQRIDARGRVLMPGFVDAHTHALWAGDRLAEFEQQQRGASYLEILAAGGGIMATVRAVRAASEDELAERLLERLNLMLREGSTTIEVKSGYGLSTESELKLLRAIHRAAGSFEGTVVPTALLGHALDPTQDRFVQRVIDETLPAVHQAFPGVTIDAYCEQGSWSVDACTRLFERASSLGHPMRVHADQFTSLGMLERALELGARSVDHLEAASRKDLMRLAAFGAYGVMLPASSFHLNQRYGNGRALLDAGGKLVIATNCNPGSAPSSSMPFVVALAVRKLGVTLAEAVSACTYTAAQLLGFEDRGLIADGRRADLILLRHRDERLLGYEVGGNPVDLVICAGNPLGSGFRVAKSAR
ncbi:MAG: imidazolonepropionase [Proteobacteria bacterium]|nr:imidazolonepropionase [Pseudomonadota bacterium]